MKVMFNSGVIKKTGWRVWALFAIAFIITLLVAAPATLLAKIVEQGSKGQFVLANATGSLWQGSATPALRQRTGKLVALERLHWNIAVLPLFTGKIVAALQWDNVAQGLPMEATISAGRVELRNALVPLQAGILGELLPMLQPVQLSGQLHIRSEQFIIAGSDMTGSAVAEWLNAGSALSPVNPLGSYRINLEGSGERLNITLATITGALLLEGSGSVTRGADVKFQATARAAPGSEGSLGELLSNFGPESAPGVRSINLMR